MKIYTYDWTELLIRRHNRDNAETFLKSVTAYVLCKKRKLPLNYMYYPFLSEALL